MYKISRFNIQIPYNNQWVLYNTFTGALSILDSPIQQIDESHYSKLVEQGFLVDDRLDELNKLEFERNRELYSSRVNHLHIEIAPTLRCQAKCWYCFENHGGIVMNRNVAEDVVAYLKRRIDSSGCKEFSLLFFGGEPLIAMDIVEIIGRSIKLYCDRKGIAFYIDIITNGINYTLDNATSLRKINVRNVQITLDGLEQRHNQAKGVDCFSAVIKNIVDCCELSNVSIRINVSTENKEEIPDLLKYLLEDLQLDGKIRVYFARVDSNDTCGIGDKTILDNSSFVDFRNNLVKELMRQYKSFEKKDLLPDIKRNYCGYECVSQIMIGPEGELYRCQRTLGDKNNSVGDIYSGSFYSDDELSIVMALEERCKKGCALLPICYGGCPNERRKGKENLNCKIKEEQIIKDIITFVQNSI